MRFLILLFLLLSFLTYSQERKFEFESIDTRTLDGWDIKKTKGQVVFYKDKKTNTVSIITKNRNNKMFVKSKQMFVTQYSYLYTLIDKYGNKSSIRVVLENESWDYIELYFYSDRPGEKYFRLCLKRCNKKIKKKLDK